MELHRISLKPAACAVDLGDGSERGEYVPQDYILQKLGRPHRAVGLMYCYYPLDEGWPQRASAAFPSSDSKDAWGYPYDDYFPYEGGLNGNPEGEPFRSMRDIRRHGQDVNLTLTIDCGVSDEHLVAIARDLRPYGRLNLRINHEATGTWFHFNKRYSYQKVADFFVRFHHIIKAEAPNVTTVLCIGGVPDDAADETAEIKCAEEFSEALRTVDVWSVDRYAALHWGWPNDFAEPGVENHLWYSIQQAHDLNKWSFDRFAQINGGQRKPCVVSEFNADGNVTGALDQTESVRAFYEAIRSGEYDCYSAITMYQFRDRGRLGLEQEDPNHSCVGIEQPLLQTYRKIISDPFFQPKILRSGETELPVQLRWGGAEDSDGLALTVALEGEPVFFEMYFSEPLNLMVEVNGRWFYKAPGTNMIDLMPAFWFLNDDAESLLTVNVFAPPSTGMNEPEAWNGDDRNWCTKMTRLPQFRIRYQPVKKIGGCRPIADPVNV